LLLFALRIRIIDGRIASVRARRSVNDYGAALAREIRDTHRSLKS
jgi:hypothetical protein